MTPDPLPSLRPPRQDRSRRTLERLEKAALTVLLEEGVEGTTVARIVDRARSSVGSFYARFATREDLFRHLEVRLWDEALERWREMTREEGWGELTPVEGVGRVLHFLVRMELEDGGRRRGLAAAAPEGPAREREVVFHAGALTELRERLLDPVPPPARHPGGMAALTLGYRIVGSAIGALARDGVDAGHLADELAHLLMAYLGVEEALGRDASPQRDQEGQDPFEVWA